MTTNRVAPADIERKEAENEMKRHTEMLLDSFEWVATAGRSAKAAGSRVITLFLIQLMLALTLVFVPVFLSGNRFSDLVLMVDSDAVPLNEEHDSFVQHLIRFSIIVGGGWAVFVIVMCLLASAPYLAKMGSRRDKLMSLKMMNFLNGLAEVSPYVSLFFGGLIASICAKYYYPGSKAFHEVVNQISAASQLAGSTESLKKTTEALTNIMTQFSATVQQLFHFRTFFPLAVHVTFTALLVLLLEKILLQVIAINFRSATTAGRFTSNVVALKLIKYLFRAKVDPALLADDRSIGKRFDKDVSEMVYDALVQEDSGQLLTVDGITKVLGEEQAVILFNFLDIAQNGDLTKPEFVEAVRAIFDESSALQHLIQDHDNIISKLDSMMMFGVYGLDVAFALSQLGVSFTSLAVGIGFLLLGAVAFFDDAVKKVIKSLVFVLITHPYDAGDRIVLDDQVYVIESVGIWTTTMYAPGALKTVAVNASLFDKKISNFRRSPSENEVMEFLFLPETVTEESLAALKEDCLNFLREKRREFQAQLVIEAVDYIDAERMKVSLKIFHRQNFQDDDAKAERSAMFLLFAKDAFLRHGFEFSPPLQKVLVAHL